MRVSFTATILFAFASLVPVPSNASLNIGVDTTVPGYYSLSADGSGGITYTHHSLSPLTFGSTLTALNPFSPFGPSLYSCLSCSPPYIETYAGGTWGGSVTPTTPFTAGLLAYDTYTGAKLPYESSYATQYFYDYVPPTFADFSNLYLYLYSYFGGGSCMTSPLSNGDTHYDCAGFTYYREWRASQYDPSFIASAAEVAAWTESQWTSWLNALATMSFYESADQYQYSYECGPAQTNSGCSNNYYAQYDGAYYYGTASINSASVPQPGTFALLGLGLAGLAVSRWRKRDLHHPGRFSLLHAHGDRMAGCGQLLAQEGRPESGTQAELRVEIRTRLRGS